MVGNNRRPGLCHAVAASVVRAGYGLITTLALITGGILLTGCPGSGITPITSTGGFTSGSPIPTGTSGNTPPFFQFTAPLTDLSREIGDIINITWRVGDPDSNALIEILLDPDGAFGNNNERVVLPLALEDSGVTSFDLDTRALGLPPASYRVIARINDGVNPELLVVAAGNILLFGAGLLPGNISPSIQVTAPITNLGVSHTDVVNIAYCGRDRDDGEDGTVPDVVLLLDFDDDPTNDLDLSGPDAAINLSNICQGGLPLNIPGAIVIGCFKDNDCANVNNATPFALTIDVGLFPPTPNGDPYRVRATMWDHTNLPVHSYAPGNISITALGSGVVDLGTVGRSISGTKFIGNDAGNHTGTNGVDIGDIDGDGFDDFVIVSKFGSTFGGQNVGSAHIVLGRAQKFGNEIPLNSITTLYRGALLTMDATPGTDGIVSVARVTDLTGDDRPEVIFGMPLVLQFFDEADDDPWDCPDPDFGADPVIVGCYRSSGPSFADRFPNPWSDTSLFISLFPRQCGQGEDCIGATDHNDVPFVPRATNPPQPLPCSNDLVFNETPIDGGYAVIVSSQNTIDGNVIGLGSVGQDYGNGAPFGVRFRGAWFPPEDRDFSQTESELALLPDNRFGQTVATMPLMTNTTLGLSPRFGPSLLISAPGAADDRGRVFYLSGNGDLTNTVPLPNSQSLPFYVKGAGPCPNVGRGRFFPRGWASIAGAAIGDHLGYGTSAGDYNLDGSFDIACGAPGADRNGIVDSGIVYVIFGRPDFSPPDLQLTNPPRMEIRGTNSGDQFGAMQTLVGDVNHDGLPDLAFASELADGPGGVDSGFIGILFGGRRLTGENIFTVNQVATAQLPGTKIFGIQPNGRAGAMISNVGDFNGDGTDDLLISAPGETLTLNGQTRRGVAYLIFGGPHLNNATLSLSQIGTPQLPGMFFVTPYITGSADDAPIDGVASAGDVNGDGFADILIGVSTADFVNPLEPSQRRVDAGECYLIYGSNTGSNSLQ